MIDLKLVLNDFENTTQKLGYKGVDVEDVQELYDLLIKRKELLMMDSEPSDLLHLSTT